MILEHSSRRHLDVTSTGREFIRYTKNKNLLIQFDDVVVVDDDDADVVVTDDAVASVTMVELRASILQNSMERAKEPTSQSRASRREMADSDGR